MAIAPGSYSFIGGVVLGNDGGKQFVLTRSDMATAFTDEEYNQCINALMNELAVAVSFGTINGIVHQAQLVSKTNLGALTFSCTRKETVESWTVAATSPHTITHDDYDVDNDITPLVNTGTKIAEGTVNGQQFELFAPSDGMEQFVLVRSNMTTDFTNQEYQDCVDAVTAGKVVCVQFVMTGTTIQAQLTQMQGSGYLVFEFSAEEYHFRFEVSSTSNAHTITQILTVLARESDIAPDWSSADVPNYGIDTIVYHDYRLYRCKVSNPSNTWVSGEWEQTTIAEELARKGDDDMNTIEVFANSDCSYEFTGNARAAVFSKGYLLLDFKTLSTGAAANTSVGFKAGDTINIVASKIKGGQAAGLQSPAMASGVTGLCASLHFELVAIDSAGQSVGATGITTNLKELDWNVFEKKGIKVTTPSTLPAGATCFGISYGGEFSCDDYNIETAYVGQTVTPELVLEIATESETVVDVATGTEIEY